MSASAANSGTASEPPSTAANAPRDLMTRLMDGYLSTQMLYVAARLGLADLLLDGPRTSTELAAATGVRILKSCRDAMPEHGRVVIADAMLGERVHDQPAAVRMDLHMLTLASGRERTAAEVTALLRNAKFRVNRVLTPKGTPGIQIVEGVPSV